MTGARAATKTWTIAIDAWHPTRLNQLIGRNRFVAQKLKRADRVTVGVCARLAGIPPATGKRRLTLTIVLGPRQRAGDPDCYWKSLLDACVHLRLLRDDNRQGVELMPVRFERGESKRSIIELEDI